MTDETRLVTHYPSSKGLVPIADMPYPHLRNAAEKMRREQRDAPMLAVMDARLAELNAAIEAAPENRIEIGHNNPPAAILTYAAVKARIDDLYDIEAKNWLDGQRITTQAQADAVSRLKGMIKEAEADADRCRKAENEPFDAGKKEVQDRYAPLISDTKAIKGKTVRAHEACVAALTPWLRKLDDEHQARLDEARRVADAAMEEARTLAGAADITNLADAEVVDETFRDAKIAARAALAVENDRARVGGGEYRATLLRDNYVPALVDGEIAMAHYWVMQRGAVEAFLLDLAAKDIRAGKRSIPGFLVDNQKRAA